MALAGAVPVSSDGEPWTRHPGWLSAWNTKISQAARIGITTTGMRMAAWVDPVTAGALLPGRTLPADRTAGHAAH
jgi:hypothetical protein